MSAFPESEAIPGVRSRGLSPRRFAAVATSLAVLGSLAIWPAIFSLWILWTTDALKSVGMLIPLVSLVLVLRVWRTLGWQAEGTWWGIVPLLFAIAAVRLQERAVLILVVSPRWSTVLPPPSLVVFAYGAGVVLLLGGPRLFRAAVFPILLLLFVNPVPHVFSLLVDWPLQRVSAHIARVFAKDLGYTLTADHLRLMFTPSFGMFIAPGCDGIRGSVTMGLIALIAGFVYQFRWYATAVVVTGAVLLGYVFNLARLCFLVLYYVVALHFVSLQGKAENADYLIGATLFLLATLLLFAVIHRLGNTRSSRALATVWIRKGQVFQNRPSRMQYVRLFAMLGAVLLGGVRLTRAFATVNSPSNISGFALTPFPQRLGNYKLVRSWNESLVVDQIAYFWGQYAPQDGGPPVALGVSPTLGWHDPLICHAVRGEHPLWQGQLTIATADSAPVSFSAALYNDGVTQYLEASTECSGGACGEFASDNTHFGFIFSRLDAKSLIARKVERPIPILLRVETMDLTMPSGAAQQRLARDLRTFLASVNLGALTLSANR